MIKTGYQLFNEFFKDEDEVIIIDDSDRIWIGKIQIYEDHCSLKDSKGSPKKILWDTIRFISHDGFPVKKLFGADGNETILKLGTRDNKKLLLEALMKGCCQDCKEIIPFNVIDAKALNSFYLPKNVFTRCSECQAKWEKAKVTMRIGHPFDIENVIVYPTIEGDWSLSERIMEPCLMMRAKDGALGQLYDLDTVFMFEVNK